MICPDYGSFARRALGRAWAYFEPGEHLSIPTREGALACVRRAATERDSVRSNIALANVVRFRAGNSPFASSTAGGSLRSRQVDWAVRTADAAASFGSRATGDEFHGSRQRGCSYQRASEVARCGGGREQLVVVCRIHHRFRRVEFCLVGRQQ